MQNALGGINLAALGQQATAESGTRIAGQKSIMDSYLASILGEQSAQNAAGSERDLRMQSFRSSQNLLAQAAEEDEMRRRQAAQQSGDSTRIAAMHGEGARNRAFGGEQADLDRAFELGSAAVNRNRFADEARITTDEGFRRALMEKQFSAPSLADFGDAAIDPLRGQLLDREGTLDGYRNANPEQWSRDLNAVRGIVGKHGADPNKLLNELRKKYGSGGADWASLALWELGYAPAE